MGMSLLDFHFAGGGPFRGIGGGYGSILTVIISFSIFGLLYKIDLHSRVINSVLSFVGAITLEIYLCYMVADKLSGEIVKDAFPQLLTGYHAQLYFIQFPLCFVIALLFAVTYKLTYAVVVKLISLINQP
ncbi:hypothetical protein [Paenibacillus sp. MMS18-CY102]|uniref:hypothetical protein n=1 Tax=Paenibacillus sp. MMS18-CY102 TaxID=2682849 RepID=UPI0013652236|nr:hypothetical protein [Paenibacillus sp. MMS18-CY102]MWC27308.1 hypothetical protein [Paenibacillus sp. MMS18-CY102]